MFARLIAAGHRQEALTGYTRRQLDLYYNRAVAQARNDRADMIENIRAALVKDGDKLIRSLRDR